MGQGESKDLSFLNIVRNIIKRDDEEKNLKIDEEYKDWLTKNSLIDVILEIIEHGDKAVCPEENIYVIKRDNKIFTDFNLTFFHRFCVEQGFKFETGNIYHTLKVPMK